MQIYANICKYNDWYFSIGTFKKKTYFIVIKKKYKLKYKNKNIRLKTHGKLLIFYNTILIFIIL